MCSSRRILAAKRAKDQTAADNKGKASAVADCCRHAKLALSCIEDRTAKDAPRVKFGAEWTWDVVRKCVREATDADLLTDKESAEVNNLVDGAEACGVWPLCKVGDNHFAMFDNRSRTTEHRWAVVKYDNPKPGSAPRRVTGGRGLMCRVSFRGIHRHACDNAM